MQSNGIHETTRMMDSILVFVLLKIGYACAEIMDGQGLNF